MKKKYLAALSAAVICLSNVGFTGVNYSQTASALSVIAQVTEFSAEKTELTVGETVATNITWGIGDHNLVYYRSSDTEVATVDQMGNITAVAPGKAVITLDASYPTEDKEIEITVLPAVNHAYPTTYKEYKALLEQCPYFYRIDEDSVYFLNHDIHSMEMSLVVSSNNELSVTNDNYGFVFNPQTDGKYVVTVSEYCEEIVPTEIEIDGKTEHWHEHRFYPELYNYTVHVKDGEISVEYKGSRSWKQQEELVVRDLESVLDGGYFSFVNGQIPDMDGGFDTYITTVYGEYSTKSYFCVNSLDSKAIVSDVNIADIDASFFTSSWVDGNLLCGTDDVQNFDRIIAKADGDVIVTISDSNGTYTYPLTVQDGIFHHAYSSAPLDSPLGDVNGDRKFDKQDVEILGKWMTNKYDIKPDALYKADFNKDGAVNVFDVMLMRKALLGASKSETKPMLMICSTETTIDFSFHESVKVIDHLGMQYTLSCDDYSNTMERSAEYWCNNIESIMKSSNKKTLIPIEDDMILGNIANFVSSASKYKDCEMEKWDFIVEDYGEDILYALYTDENGSLKPVELCRFGGECAWLDDENVQLFVKMLFENEYFGDKSMFEHFYYREIPLID